MHNSQVAHTKINQRKYTFFGRISPNNVLYSYFEGVYYFSMQKKNFQKNDQTYMHYPFKYYDFLLCLLAIHTTCFISVVNKLSIRGYQPHLQELLLRLNFNDYYKDR